MLVRSESRLNAACGDNLKIFLGHNDYNGHALGNPRQTLSNVDPIGDPVSTCSKSDCRAVSNATNSIFSVLEMATRSLTGVAVQKKSTQVSGAGRNIPLPQRETPKSCIHQATSLKHEVVPVSFPRTSHLFQTEVEIGLSYDFDQREVTRSVRRLPPITYRLHRFRRSRHFPGSKRARRAECARSSHSFRPVGTSVDRSPYCRAVQGGGRSSHPYPSCHGARVARTAANCQSRKDRKASKRLELCQLARPTPHSESL